MVEYIVEKLKVPNQHQINDKPWWTGNKQGNFTVKSVWEVKWSKMDRKREYKNV